MHFFIQRLYFPVAVFGSIALFFFVHANGGNLELTVLASSVTVALFAFLLE